MTAALCAEAFRLGVTPPGGVDWYTVGRAELFAAVREDLAALETGGRMRLVIGGYGSGKSHLLAWIRERALAEGFVVGEAALDDHDVTPAQPKRLYRALATSLRYPEAPDRAQGLLPLLERLLRSPGYPRERGAEGHHRYLDPALACLKAAREKALYEAEVLALDWLEGQPFDDSRSTNARLRGIRTPWLPALPDYRTFGHVYAYLLGGLAAAARDAGWRGLVLLVDEAEFYELLSRQHREHAKNVLASLALATRGPGHVCFDAETLKRGGQASHREIPAVYREGQPLYAVAALTPVDRMRELLASLVPLEQVAVELAPLAPADYAELFARVTAAYPVPPERRELLAQVAGTMGRALHAGVGSGALASPRAVLKAIVELLDVVRLRPAAAKTFAQELVRAIVPATPLIASAR